MKVLALGGTGAVGRGGVRTILRSKGLDQLLIACRSFDMASSFAKSLEDKRVSACSIDVEDTNALEWLCSQADMVMNSVGYLYRIAPSIIRTAIKTGCHYVDIAGNQRSAQESLKLDEDARQAGVTVLIGMGASPGITNILARHAANQLDEVDYVQTAWGFVGGIYPPRSALVGEEVTVPFSGQRLAATAIDSLYSAIWRVLVFHDGKLVDVIPLEEGEEITFPQGKGFFQYCGQSEPVTLPHFIKGLEGAAHLVGRGPEELDVLRELAARAKVDELTLEEAAAMYPAELLKKRLQRPDKPVDMGPRVGGLQASVSGRKGGKRIRYGYGLNGGPPGGMAGHTGIPFALGTEMIINGEINQRGVLAPEACIEPLPFLERYMRYWSSPPESVEQAIYEVVEEIQ